MWAFMCGVCALACAPTHACSACACVHAGTASLSHVCFPLSVHKRVHLCDVAFGSAQADIGPSGTRDTVRMAIGSGKVTGHLMSERVCLGPEEPF